MFGYRGGEELGGLGVPDPDGGEFDAGASQLGEDVLLELNGQLPAQ